MSDLEQNQVEGSAATPGTAVMTGVPEAKPPWSLAGLLVSWLFSWLPASWMPEDAFDASG